MTALCGVKHKFLLVSVVILKQVFHGGWLVLGVGVGGA